MRRRVLALALGLALLPLRPSPADAGATLEQRVAAATGISRTIDAGLQARAAARAVQIESVFDHCCLGPGEAEVIAWNRGYDDPLGVIVNDWRGSTIHWHVLSDRSYSRIGCGTAQLNGGTYGVCILAVGHQPAPAPPAGPPPPAPPPPATTLPNTALH